MPWEREFGRKADRMTKSGATWLYLRQKNIFHTRSQTWGPFLESPGNFSGPKSNIQIEIRLMNFVLLLISLRDRLLSLQNDDTMVKNSCTKSK